MKDDFGYLPEDLETIMDFMNGIILSSAIPDLRWYDKMKEEYITVLNYIMDN